MVTTDHYNKQEISKYFGGYSNRVVTGKPKRSKAKRKQQKASRKRNR